MLSSRKLRRLVLYHNSSLFHYQYMQEFASLISYTNVKGPEIKIYTEKEQKKEEQTNVLKKSH